MNSTQYRIVSRQFGYPIYLGSDADITDNKAEASIFLEGEDNLTLKARNASTVFGYAFEPELAK